MFPHGQVTGVRSHTADHVEDRELVGEIPAPGIDESTYQGRLAGPTRAGEKHRRAIELDRASVDEERARGGQGQVQAYGQVEVCQRIGERDPGVNLTR